MKLLFQGLKRFPDAPREGWWRKKALAVFEAVRRPDLIERAEVSVVLVSKAHMRRLNNDAFRKNRPTDVLAFPQWEGRIPRSFGNFILLGDVVICPQVVREQAEREKRLLRAQWALLWVHGLLHLLGFDHDTPRRKKKMFRLQDVILEKTEGKAWMPMS